MQQADELAALEEYVRTRDGRPFRRLVDRYIDIVYAAAKRQTGDRHLAEDVTQAVFLVFARKAATVPTDRPLSAWLLKTTAYCASNARRARGRRVAHESEAAGMMQSCKSRSSQSEEGDWESVSPILDEGLGKLPARERDLLLRRFFEGRSVRQIALELEVSEEAAAKRLSRAVERLRDFFRRRGVVLSGAALSTVLISRITEAAPAGLASAASLAGAGQGSAGSAATFLAKGAMTMAALEKLKLAGIVVVAMLLIGGGVGAVAYSRQKPRIAWPKAAQGPQGQIAQSSWPIVFTDGTVVEILGIQDDPPADAARWWLPDGSEIPMPHFPRGGPMEVSGFGAKKIRFIIRMEGAGDRNLKVVVTPRHSDADSVTSDSRGYFVNLLVAIPRNSETASVKIAMGAGPWVETTLYDAATATVKKPSGVPVQIGGIREEKGRTIVQAFEAPQGDPQQDEGIVLLANGKRLPAGQVSRSFGSVTYTFDCPKAQMSQVLFRSRPFEFIELRNVSLSPTTVPVAVQTVKVPSTAP